MRREQPREIARILEQTYGTPDLGNLPDPIDEAVFIVLSEKTDHKRYAASFARLVSGLVGGWEDLLRTPVSRIERLIRNAGMGRKRARLLKRLFRGIKTRFGSLDLSSLSSMPPRAAEAELIRLPGIGHKTARCILLYCFGLDVLPVDIHTYRLAVRLGLLSRRVSYAQSHHILPELIPSGVRRAFHVNAIAHGRTRCFANKPLCAGCPLAQFCSHPGGAGTAKPLRIESRPRPLAIDICAGAGGLSLGLQRAGFEVVQAMDSNTHAMATYRHNNPAADVIEEDIRRLDPWSCLQRLGLRPGDLTALVGGVPCQGFSESNRRTRNLSNPQNHLYRDFFRFVEVMKPTWIVLENVAGLRTLAKGAILKRILRKCRALGYSADWAELNAADFGVPQLRHRIFIVGNRLGLSVPFPKPTHGPNLTCYVSVRGAIADLPVLRNGASTDLKTYRTIEHPLGPYQTVMRESTNGSIQGNLVSHNADVIIDRYKHIGQGQNWEAIPAALMSNYEDSSRCHTGIYYRLLYDKPAKVIGNFRKNMLIHPTQNRGLSIREAARLQSFPDDYEFLGSIGFQQQQVADAVPPLLAEAVAVAILRTDRRAFNRLVRQAQGSTAVS